jgi:hypothetical protein
VAVLVEAEHALLAHQRLHLRSLREAVLNADAIVGLHLATQAAAASAPSTALLLILQTGLMPKATEGKGGQLVRCATKKSMPLKSHRRRVTYTTLVLAPAVVALPVQSIDRSPHSSGLCPG